MKTLYASDLDGTLLTKEERVSPYSCEKLNRMIENGLLFTFATARSVSSARNAVRGLDVTAPVILYNGGLVYDFNAKRDLHSVLFADDVKEYVLSLLRQYGIMPFVFAASDDRERVLWKSGEESPGMARYLCRRREDPRMEAVGSERELLGGYTFNFKCIGAKRQTRANCSKATYFILSVSARANSLNGRGTTSNSIRVLSVSFIRKPIRTISGWRFLRATRRKRTLFCF